MLKKLKESFAREAKGRCDRRRDGRRRLQFERLEDRRALAGETFFVTNTNNSGAGSLRQAIIDANADTTGDFISFAPLAANQTINLSSPLPAVTSPVDFNGNSISGFNGVPLVEVHATYATHGSQPHGLLFQGSGFCQVIGISITGFPGDGIHVEGTSSYLRIEDSYVGVSVAGQMVANKGDGVELVATSTNITHIVNSVLSGNDGYGINLQTGAKNIQIVGNLVGTNPAGNAAYPNKAGGILVSEAAGVNIRDGNVISGNGQVGLGGNGITIVDVPQSGAVTIGPSTAGPANVIGLNKGGNATLANQGSGVRIEYSSGSIVKDNIISGNVRYGIVLWGANSQAATTGTRIEANTIGTNADGLTTLGNGQGGIYLADPANDSFKVSDNFIFDNIIAHNGASTLGGGAGIRLETTAGINNRIQQNSIYANAGLGIDLDAYGVTPNDSGDADSGPNDNQNFPVITRADRISGLTFLDVTLNSTPLASFTVEIFVSESPDSNGDVEGKTWLTSATFPMPQTGNYTFPVSADIPAGHFITATATKNVTGQSFKGSTSEFSLPVKVLDTYEYNGTMVNVSIDVGNSRLTGKADGPVTVTVDPPQSAAVVTKTGTGTFFIDSVTKINTNLPLEAVDFINDEGTTQFNADTGQSQPTRVANWSVDVDSGTSVIFNSTQNLTSLTIGENAIATIAETPWPQSGTIVYKVLVLDSLAIAGTPSQPTGTLDITNNALVIHYSDVNPESTIRQWILSGRGGVGLGAPWTGKGITSSTAAARNVTEPESRSVGYVVNGSLPFGAQTVFLGQNVDGTTVLVRYTITGDHNLDGTVDDADSTVFGANYAPGVPNPNWSQGDFDYNGFVDDTDSTLFGALYDPSYDIDEDPDPKPAP